METEAAIVPGETCLQATGRQGLPAATRSQERHGTGPSPQPAEELGPANTHLGFYFPELWGTRLCGFKPLVCISAALGSQYSTEVNIDLIEVSFLTAWYMASPVFP